MNINFDKLADAAYAYKDPAYQNDDEETEECAQCGKKCDGLYDFDGKPCCRECYESHRQEILNQVVNFLGGLTDAEITLMDFEELLPEGLDIICNRRKEERKEETIRVLSRLSDEELNEYESSGLYLSCLEEARQRKREN